ncbi:MAG: hypothetical protein IPQ07_25645 [Myxococcales bacterium]|nr:hypothetical protein [Myxococcales bacterium]
MRAALTALTLAVGCGSGSSTTTTTTTTSHPTGPYACPSDHPLGTEAVYTAPADLPGFVIAAPQHCARDEAYIRIERAAGSRKLGTGRGKGGGFDEGCMTLPADPADPAQCPVINAGAVMTAAHYELEKRHLVAPGVGLGPCGDLNGDYAAWHMAVGVHDWNDTATAIRIVTELFERYDVAGFVGVAVRGIPCAIAL